MKSLWFAHITHYKAQYSLILSSILLGIAPALLLIILLSYAIKQLNSMPALIPWPELLGEHASRWLRPYVRGTAFQDGLSVEFQAQWFVPILIMVALANWLFKFAQEYLAEDMGEKIARDLRFSVSKRWCSLPFSQAQQTEASLLASMMGDDTREIRQNFSRQWGSLISDGINSLVLVAWLIILDTQLFILFVFILLPAGIVLHLTGKTLKKLSRQGINQQSDMLGLLLERLRGWQTIRVHKALDHEMNKFEETNKSLFHVWRRAARAKAASAPVVEWLGITAAACVIIVALKRIAEDALTSHVLTAFLVTVGYLSTLIQSMTNQLQGAKKANAALNRIHDFLANKPETYKEESKQVRPLKTEHKQLLSIHLSQIQAKTPDERVLFSNLEAHIRTGDVCAIVGPSGTGKSTLLRILLGLEQATRGKVYLNGEAFSEEQFKKISETTLFVAQEPFLINGSIAENVAYPQFFEASMEPFVKECLEDVNLNKSIYEPVLSLSGGEKQRLMFARGLFNRAQLWIIDEATSALDMANEELILRRLINSKEDKIIIAVTHRKKILNDANVVINLEQLKEAVT